jgi:O-glycosyl hydrolase
MKTNREYSGFGFIRESMYQTWANYFVKFLDEYQNEGVTFWGVTTGNEPADAFIFRDQLEVVGWTPWLVVNCVYLYSSVLIEGSRVNGSRAISDPLSETRTIPMLKS